MRARVRVPMSRRQGLVKLESPFDFGDKVTGCHRFEPMVLEEDADGRLKERLEGVGSRP
jgi:hypothetical protein